MSLDAKKLKLSSFGKVTINSATNEIEIEGFNGEGCTCRDVFVLACIWAIGELQREVLASVEQPGFGSAVITG
jgi:uncharacterized protein YggL (DUF469 family)